MANHKSALKRVRQSEKRRLKNKMNKTKVKNTIKATRLAVDESPEKAGEALRTAMSVIDRAAAKGSLHRKTASRRIARLSKRVAKAQAVASA